MKEKCKNQQKKNKQRQKGSRGTEASSNQSKLVEASSNYQKLVVTAASNNYYVTSLHTNISVPSLHSSVLIFHFKKPLTYQ